MRTDGRSRSEDPLPPGPPDAASGAAADPLGGLTKPAAPRKPTIGQKAVRGAFWTIGLALGSKVITFVTQMALAWLLVPEAFGLIGQAYTVTAFAGLIVNPGIDRILIQRYAHRRRWLGPAFWMSFVLSLVGTAAMLAVIPLAVAAYRSPELWTLIPVVALATPLGALGLVPRTMLLAEMDFKRLTILALAFTGTGSAISVVAAACGLGALSFVIGLPIAALLQTGLAWAMVPGRAGFSWRPRIRRWRFLLGDSLALFLFGVAGTFMAQADYAVLGWLYDERTLGIYFFAFGLSLQTFVLVNAAVGSVALPSLAGVEAPATRAHLLKTGAILIAMIAVPFAFLQAALTGPLVSIVFPDKWLDAIPVVQVLCLGMAFRTVGVAAQSLMQADGLYWRITRLVCVEALLFVALLVPLAIGYAGTGAAVAVASSSAVANFAWLAVALGRHPDQRREALRGVATVCLLAALPAVPCWVLAEQSMRLDAAPRAAAAVALGAGYAVATCVLLRSFAPASWRMLVAKLRRRRTAAA